MEKEIKEKLKELAKIQIIKKDGKIIFVVNKNKGGKNGRL